MMQNKANRQALKVVLTYVITAGCWILFSDRMLWAFVHDRGWAEKISIFKGWAFVLVTGGLLYLALRRIFQSWARVEAAVRENEARFHQLADNINDVFWICSPDFKTVHFVSEGYQRIWGRATDSLYANPLQWEEAILPDERERVFRAFASLRESEPEISIEYRIARPDGSIRWVHDRGFQVRDAAGRVVRLAGIACDITERKWFEQRSECFSQLGLQLSTVTAEKEAARIITDAAFKLLGWDAAYLTLCTTDAEVVHKLINLDTLNGQRCEVPLPAALSKPTPHMLRVLEQGAKLILRPDSVPLRPGGDAPEPEANLTPFGDVARRSRSLMFVPVRIAGRAIGVLSVQSYQPDAYQPRDLEALQALADHAAGALARLQFETALRERQEQLRLYAEHIPAAVAMFDRDMRYLVASQRWMENNRFTDRSFLGRSHYELVPDIPERWKEIHRRCLSGAIEKCDADPFVRADGRTDWIRWEVRPWCQASGLIGGIIIFYENITERRQAETALERNHEMYRRAIAAANAIPYQKDYASDSYVFMGEGICDLTGYTAAELRSAVWREMILDTIFIGEAAGLTANEAIRRILAGESQSWQADHRIRTRSGAMRWISDVAIPIFNAAGKYTGSVGIIQDITARKRAEEQMNVQSSALTTAANAIVITDRQGKIEWVNPAFTKLTGYSAPEAVGNNPRVLKSGQHPPAFYANLWGAILAGNVWHGELINRRKDGQHYTEEMTITPVRGADGQIAHFVAIKQDVTDRRVVEKRMQQAQKMEAIGTLAGGIAHDFNNILAAMFGYAYLLQQDTDGQAAAQENIGEILKAANRAKDLVQQILTFSRQREQKPQVMKLDTVVKDAIKFLRASLPAQIKIEMNLSPDAPDVLADPTQIYQVAINLATNALHAMEGKPGRLTVHLEPCVPDEQLIRSHPELRPIAYARLTVADTGHGMDAKTMERIFEPFFTTKPVGKGTGLGLAVVHGIIQSHEGVITVESEVGRGTTFALYFPGQHEGAMPRETGREKIAAGQGQKILLLDDEFAVTAVLELLLRRLNYQVTACNNAREALEQCRQNPAQFDLAITDLTMPEMNGLEVARQLRALRPDLPIILTSGFIAELQPENLRAAGIGEFLEKPVSLASLAEAVQRAFANARKDVCHSLDKINNNRPQS